MFSIQIRTASCFACGKGWGKMDNMDEKFGAENLQYARDGALNLVFDFGHLTEGSDITWE